MLSRSTINEPYSPKKPMSPSAAPTRDILVDPGAKSKQKGARRKPLTETAARKVPSTATKTTQNGARPSARKKVGVQKMRTSQILRDILTKNPDVSEFTVEQIVSSIGET